MFGLALGQGNFALHAAIFPVQVQRNERVAPLLHLADQAADFVAVHEQLFGARRLGAHMRAGGAQRVDLAANDKQLPAANDHVAVGQLRLARAQRLHFPALQHHARFVALFKKVIEGGLFIAGNDGVGRFGSGFFLGGHA